MRDLDSCQPILARYSAKIIEEYLRRREERMAGQALEALEKPKAAKRRLGMWEVLEGLGRSRSWLYGHMGEEKGPDRFPHRKLDGELIFTAGELRAWIRDHEELVAGGRTESTSEERRGLLRAS